VSAHATPVPHIRLVVAPNAGPSTHDGTNTYLIDEADGVTVIDAGPAIEAHVEAIVAAAGRPIRRILTTHGHRDHAGAARALAARTGAPVLAYRVPLHAEYAPDIALDDGARIGALTAIHTPGHAPDHLCFSHAGTVLFSGDTVLDWASSLVMPPHGDMGHYMDSLARLGARSEALCLPGHGPPVTDPRARIADLLARRQHREATILAQLAGSGATLDALTARFYGRKPDLQVTGRGVLEAHLIKLQREGRAAVGADGLWVALPPRPGDS